MTSGRLDWVCIGAQKAGTTTLFRVLRQHPRLLIPPGKEDPLFDREVSAAEVERYLEERFAGAPAGVRCGTVTPPYMSSRTTAARLHRFAPDARVVVLLRDPVSRAFSHYRMSVRRGIENRSFSEAIGAQLESLDRGAAIDVDSETATYVERGRYGHILAPWWELFGPEGIHVELLADLNARPAEVFGRVQCFLGVEPLREHA